MPKKKLNANQEAFCQYFVNNEECFGNATRSYAMAYGRDLDDPKINHAIRSDGYHLMGKEAIKARLQELLDILISDTIVDIELARVIKQNENLAAKVSAIKEYNAVKKRTLNKVELELPQSLVDLIKNAINPSDKE